MAPESASSTRSPKPAACCSVADVATQAPCSICRRITCRACRGMVNGRRACADCVAQAEAEIADERAGAAHLPGAVLGGLAAALVAGGVWALIAIATHLAIGWVAVGVGVAAGIGVVLGAGRRTGPALQGIAAGCAFLGLLLGKYFTVAHYVMKENPEADLSYANPRLFGLFLENITEFIRPFDALWVVLALSAAVGIPRASGTRVRKGRGAR